VGESPVIRALGGIDATLEPGEALIGAAVDVADRRPQIELVEDGGAGIFDVMGPELGFDTRQPLEEPVGADQGIDQETLEVSGRLPFLMVADGHGFEFGGIFAEDHQSLGVDGRFQSA